MIKDPPKKGKDKYLDMLLDQVTEGELRSMNSGDDDDELRRNTPRGRYGHEYTSPTI